MVKNLLTGVEGTAPEKPIDQRGAFSDTNPFLSSVAFAPGRTPNLYTHPHESRNHCMESSAETGNRPCAQVKDSRDNFTIMRPDASSVSEITASTFPTVDTQTSKYAMHGPRAAVCLPRKRKLDEMGLAHESASMSKESCSAEKEDLAGHPNPEIADEYSDMPPRALRYESLCRSLEMYGSKQELANGLKRNDAGHAQTIGPPKSVEETGYSCLGQRPDMTDRYTGMRKRILRKECLRRSLLVSGTKDALRKRLRRSDAAQAQITTSRGPVEQNGASCYSPEPEVTDIYTGMRKRILRKECLRRSLLVSGTKDALRKRLRRSDAAQAQITTSRGPVERNGASCHSPGPEVKDRYTHIGSNELREESYRRGLPLNLSNKDQRHRFKTYDAAQMPGLILQNAEPQESITSQESIVANTASYLGSETEIEDRCTQMGSNELREESSKRGLPLNPSNTDHRRCLRIYDAARTLGITREEAVEAQEAHPATSRELSASKPTFQASRNDQTAVTRSLESPEERALRINSGTKKNVGALRRLITEDRKPRTMSQGYCKNRDKNGRFRKRKFDNGVHRMSGGQNRDQHQFENTLDELDLALRGEGRNNDQNGRLDDSQDHWGALVDFTKTSLPIPYIDLDTSSDDGSKSDESPERLTKVEGFTTGSQGKEPILNHPSTTGKAQRPGVPADPNSTNPVLQEILKDKTVEYGCSKIPLKKDCTTRLIAKAPMSSKSTVNNIDGKTLTATDGQDVRFNKYRALRGAPEPYIKTPQEPMHGVQKTCLKKSLDIKPYVEPSIIIERPLVALLSLTFRDAETMETRVRSGEQTVSLNEDSMATRAVSIPATGVNLDFKPYDLAVIDTCVSTYKETLEKTKADPLLAHARALAEKEAFEARYTPGSPSWICCCTVPGNQIRQRPAASFSGNCLYHVPEIAQQGTYTIAEYQGYVARQNALDRQESCLCQKLATDHQEHCVIITTEGFVLAQIWREQLYRRYFRAASSSDVAEYRRQGLYEVMHNIFHDFMFEISSHPQIRPLALWARVEAMAWFINTFSTGDEWHGFENWRRPCQYIMLFGEALLTMIVVLVQQKMFKDNEQRIPNLSLVLALFIESTWSAPSSVLGLSSNHAYQSPFSDEVCINNENGWAAEVIDLADQHKVRIHGTMNIVFTVDRWRLKKKAFQSSGDRNKKMPRTTLHMGEMILPEEATLTSTTTNGCETGQRGLWRPEDDYDSSGTRLWKNWSFLWEYDIYTKEDEATRIPVGASRLEI